jgi:hypothetical protein
VADIPELTRLYQENMAALQLSTSRDEDYWRYLLVAAHYPVRMVEDVHDRRVVGYICTLGQGDKRGLRVIESSITQFEVGLAVLQQLRAETEGELRLGWPVTNILVQIGRSLGSAVSLSDQWLLRIPDVAAFLTKLAPVFERRLITAGCIGLTARLCINLFRQAFDLRFELGKLVQVAPIGFVDASMGADGGDLCIPPDAFVRLILGYRDLDELRDAWPDIVVKAKSRYLLQVLFPKMTSYFWMPYLYYGSI